MSRVGSPYTKGFYVIFIYLTSRSTIQANRFVSPTTDANLPLHDTTCGKKVIEVDVITACYIPFGCEM